MPDEFRNHLVSLREQVAVSVEVAAEASREYHETWSHRKGLASRKGGNDAEVQRLENLRRREMLYLGEAAALQWILGRLDQLVAEVDPDAVAVDQIIHEPSQPSTVPTEPAIHD